MQSEEVARWMLSEIERADCIYQDDVVDFLVRRGLDGLLRENADGNLVVGRKVLDSFLALTKDSVVWVKPDRYWRSRVTEDESGREARG